MMAFYQNVAENGPAVCQGPEKILPCVDTNLHNLPKADGVMLFDSHLGDSLATFTYIDPAVIGNTLGARDPSLDMFSAANGYNAATNGATYTAHSKNATRQLKLSETSIWSAQALPSCRREEQPREIPTIWATAFHSRSSGAAQRGCGSLT